MSSAKTTAKEFFDSGMAAFTRADLIAATEDFQACVDRDPKNPEAWYYLGMAALPRDFARAKVALDHALALAPEYHGILYWRAEADFLLAGRGVAGREEGGRRQQKKGGDGCDEGRRCTIPTRGRRLSAIGSSVVRLDPALHAG